MEKEKYVLIRSFLGSNSEVLLESLNQFRHHSKIDSDDLFASSDDNTAVKINYNLNFSTKSKKDILIEEKNSLGLYVSGNPLADYRELVTDVQDAIYRDDINLILINKIKKIFTKKNAMMFALMVSTPFGDYEAIIFPKKAMGLSPILLEKEIFWVTGKIDEGQKGENSKVGEDGEAIEFEQKPKILIDEMIHIDSDLIEFIGRDKKNPPSASSIRRVEDILSERNRKPSPQKTSTEKPAQPQNKTKMIKIHREYGLEKTRQIKSLLKKDTFDSATKVKIQIEVKPGEWKTAKGEFWVDIDKIESLGIDIS